MYGTQASKLVSFAPEYQVSNKIHQKSLFSLKSFLDGHVILKNPLNCCEYAQVLTFFVMLSHKAQEDFRKGVICLEIQHNRFSENICTISVFVFIQKVFA